jgi:hypothetical protein
LGGAIIGHHPDAVDEKVSPPKNGKGDYDCENKTLDIHLGDSSRDFIAALQVNP